MKALCETRPRDKAPHVALPCVPLQHEPSILSRLPWGCRGGCWQEDATHGDRGGGESVRTDFAEIKGRLRRNKVSLCSPLQLEVGHSSLEEANSHAGVLGHCLVKCLGTKMPMDRQGLQFYHPRVTDIVQADDQWPGAKEFHWLPGQPPADRSFLHQSRGLGARAWVPASPCSFPRATTRIRLSSRRAKSTVKCCHRPMFAMRTRGNNRRKHSSTLIIVTSWSHARFLSF